MFRVESEIIRDIHLQAGGLLSPKVGGPTLQGPALGQATVGVGVTEIEAPIELSTVEHDRAQEVGHAGPP